MPVAPGQGSLWPWAAERRWLEPDSIPSLTRASARTIRNVALYGGLLWSQTVENASQLTYLDDRKNRHVSRVIHLLEQIGPS